MSGDAKQLIETAAKAFLEEVPALKPMKVVVGFDLIGGRSDLQQFRLQLPELEVTKDMATDARIRVEMRREFFNLMVEHGAKVADWREAFHDGKAKASGVEQYLKLILTVVEKQEERDRLRRPKHQRPH
jgi:hypothetical protein